MFHFPLVKGGWGDFLSLSIENSIKRVIRWTVFGES